MRVSNAPLVGSAPVHRVAILAVRNVLLGDTQQIFKIHVLIVLRAQRVRLLADKDKHLVPCVVNLSTQLTRIERARVAPFLSGHWTMEMLVTIKVVEHTQIVSMTPMAIGIASEENAWTSLEKQLDVVKRTARHCARCLMLRQLIHLDTDQCMIL